MTIKNQEKTHLKSVKKLKILDLFSGMGGMKLGFEQASKELGYEVETIYFSDIKKHSKKILNLNYPNVEVIGDITKVNEKEIPDFDFLLGGFPCQAFSSAGKRAGFEDTRGTLFFDIARILKEKNPEGFLLENVEGLITHNRINKKDPIGETFKTILQVLEDLGYNVSWKLINATDFNVPQERKRVYILGTRKEEINFDDLPEKIISKNEDILEKGVSVVNNDFTKKLLANFQLDELYGKSIKDKRGGKSNIHSWDFGLKGSINKRQKKLLSLLLLERRKKHWAEKKGIPWMDGMPLTLEEIKTFTNYPELSDDLSLLVSKGYIKEEHPKNIVYNEEKRVNERVEDPSIPKGYNIVTGKLSFEVSKILDPKGTCPTLLATDMDKIYVVDEVSKGIRPLSIKEGLRMFGYPDDYKIEGLTKKEMFDLLGNTVVVPVIKELAKLLIKKHI